MLPTYEVKELSMEEALLVLAAEKEAYRPRGQKLPREPLSSWRGELDRAQLIA